MPKHRDDYPDAALIQARDRFRVARASYLVANVAADRYTEKAFGDIIDRQWEAMLAVLNAPAANTLDGAHARAEAYSWFVDMCEGASHNPIVSDSFARAIAADIQAVRASMLQPA